MHQEFSTLIGNSFTNWLILANVEEIEKIPKLSRSTGVYLVDEADSVMGHIVSFGGDHSMNGCAYFKTVSTYFFTATLDPTVRELMVDCFGKMSVEVWKSQYQISQEDEEHFKITANLFVDETSIVQGLAKSLRENPTAKPIIVFYERMTNALNATLS